MGTQCAMTCSKVLHRDRVDGCGVSAQMQPVAMVMGPDVVQPDKVSSSSKSASWLVVPAPGSSKGGGERPMLRKAIHTSAYSCMGASI